VWQIATQSSPLAIEERMIRGEDNDNLAPQLRIEQSQSTYVIRIRNPTDGPLPIQTAARSRFWLGYCSLDSVLHSESRRQRSRGSAMSWKFPIPNRWWAILTLSARGAELACDEQQSKAVSVRELMAA
jgi:hypothetical protein